MDMKINGKVLSRVIILWIGIMGLLGVSTSAKADAHREDSLRKAITIQKDTNLVIAYWDLSYAIHNYANDTALDLAYKGLTLAQKLKYLRGMAGTYEMIALILSDIGNYNRALEYHLQCLKIQEQRNYQKGIISSYNNIGIVYLYMKDYAYALKSYKTADSINATLHDSSYAYSLTLNIGDVYEELKNVDSAFIYYNKALILAYNLKDEYFIGLAMLGLGNIYRMKNDYELAKSNYTFAISKLANDEDQLCEAALGLAKVYEALGKTDSMFHYSGISLQYARKNRLHRRELDACSFLGEQFSKVKKFDSAYTYLNRTISLKDSLLSTEEMRVSQQIKFEENLRQKEMAEQRMAAEEERKDRLQHILIIFFIPSLFFITILLSRVRVKLSVIKFLGVVSLLFLFEYITLLLHPQVQRITHHTPILEILLFVGIASLLIPAHHKIEHWVINTLVNRSTMHGHQPTTIEPVPESHEKRVQLSPKKKKLPRWRKS